MSTIKIQTSSYGLSGRKPNAIGISRGKPKTFSGPIYLALAPTWAMLKMSHRNYLNEFDKILAGLNPHDVAMAMDGKIMLCYEKPGEFCHRRLVADWLEKALNIKVPEVGYTGAFDLGEQYRVGYKPPEKKGPSAGQMMMSLLF